MSFSLTETQNLYLSFHALFGEGSSILKTQVQEKLAAEAKEIASSQTKLVSPEIEPEPIYKKATHLFIRATEVSLEGLDASTMAAMGRSAETTQEIYHSFEAMSALSGFLTTAAVLADYKAIKKQKMLLQSQGLLLTPISDGAIFKEAANKQKLPLILSTVGLAGTLLLTIPEPTFITKLIAALAFTGISWVGAYTQAKAAHETTIALNAVKAHPRALLSTEKMSYQELITKILQETPQNRILIQAFLTAGEELKKAEIDLKKTHLSEGQWHQLVEKTLRFKRLAHRINCAKGILAGFITAALMIPGAFGLLFKGAKILAKKMGMPLMFSSSGVTFLNLVKNFSQKSLFQRFILRKLDFQSSLVHEKVDPVFTQEEMKKFESKEIQILIKKNNLSATVDILNNLKENDSLFLQHPELREKIDALKKIDRDSKRIEALIDIGRLIDSISALSEEDADKARKKLKSVKDLEKKDKDAAEIILKMLIQNPLTGYSESIQTLLENLKARLDSGEITGFGVQEIFVGLQRQLSAPPTPAIPTAADAFTPTAAPAADASAAPTPHAPAPTAAPHPLISSTPPSADPVVRFSPEQIRLILKALDEDTETLKSSRQKIKDMLENYSKINLHGSVFIADSFRKIERLISERPDNPKDVLSNAHKVTMELLQINSSVISMSDKEAKKAKELLKGHFLAENSPPDQQETHEKHLDTLEVLRKLNIHPEDYPTGESLADLLKKLKKQLAKEKHTPEEIKEIREGLSHLHDRLSPHLSQQNLSNTDMTFFHLPGSGPTRRENKAEEGAEEKKGIRPLHDSAPHPLDGGPA